MGSTTQGGSQCPASNGIRVNRQRGKRLLLIASPTNRTYDAAEDNRPNIYVGHFGHAEDAYVPARIWGMSANEASATFGGNILGGNRPAP
jgi:hypothetical protein